MAEIGSRGGQKSPGNFDTTPGLAKLAGIRSGMVRRLKKLAIEIETLESQREPQIELIKAKKAQYAKLQAEIERGDVKAADRE